MDDDQRPSIWLCTILHRARIFPAPNPQAPRRSINSRKNVSLLKIDLVKICSKTLDEYVVKAEFFFPQFFLPVSISWFSTWISFAI